MDASVNPPRSEKATRLLALADYIEDGRSPFDMTDWDTCIAGQCAHMNGEHFCDPPSFTRQWLHLSAAESHMLFAPSEDQLNGGRHVCLMLDHITRAWAAATLRHLAVTGKIDWAGARPSTAYEVLGKRASLIIIDPLCETIHLTVTLPPLREPA